MKTISRSQELWELVEKGICDGEDEVKQRENKKNDAKVPHSTGGGWTDT